MRHWALYRKNQPKFKQGTPIVSFIYQDEGKICREDRPEAEMKLPDDLPEGCLGWWRATARAKPPTQKQLNERLERIFLETKEMEDDSQKQALLWLVGLYLVRKRIVRQYGTTFTHIKSGHVVKISDPDALDPETVQTAMGELLEAIS